MLLLSPHVMVLMYGACCSLARSVMKQNQTYQDAHFRFYTFEYADFKNVNEKILQNWEHPPFSVQTFYM